MDQDYKPLAHHLSKASLLRNTGAGRPGQWLHSYIDAKAHTFTSTSYAQEGVREQLVGSGKWKYIPVLL